MVPGRQRVLVIVVVVLVVAAGLSAYEVYNRLEGNPGHTLITLDQSTNVTVLNGNGSETSVNLSLSGSFVYVPGSDHGKLVVNESLHRIVTLVPSITVTLYGLGVYNETVVGVDQYSTYPSPSTFVQVLNIQPSSMPVEDIKNLTPDAVMSTSGYFTTQEINQLVNVLDIPFYVFDPNNMSQIEYQNNQLGELTDSTTNATLVNGWMNQNLNALKNDTNRITGNPISVLYDLGPGSSGLYTAGNDTFINEIFNLVHLRNVVNQSGYPDLSAEEILSLKPNWVLLDQYYNTSSLDSSAPGLYSEVNGNVSRIANDSFIDQNDFRVIYAAFWIGNQFYPSYISLGNVSSFSGYTGIQLNPSPEDGINGTA